MCSSGSEGAACLLVELALVPRVTESYVHVIMRINFVFLILFFLVGLYSLCNINNCVFVCLSVLGRYLHLYKLYAFLCLFFVCTFVGLFRHIIF